jgi:hypothetical protein
VTAIDNYAKQGSSTKPYLDEIPKQDDWRWLLGPEKVFARKIMLATASIRADNNLQAMAQLRDYLLNPECKEAIGLPATESERKERAEMLDEYIKEIELLDDQDSEVSRNCLS